MPQKKHAPQAAPGLRGISNRARTNYAEYKRTYTLENKRIARIEDQMQQRAHSPYERGIIGQEERDRRIGEFALQADRLASRERSEAIARQAGAHVAEHQAEYHDLAVIEAFLDEKPITVAEPLEIGRKDTEDPPQ